MALSSELISKFAKVVTQKEKQPDTVTVIGTAVTYEGKIYVRLDGTDQLTPVASSTAGMRDGDRVTVQIKNHSATVTGNVSSPSTGKEDLEDTKEEIGNKITEVEILIADKVSTKEFDAEKARIDDLVADNVTIKDTLTASKAEIDQLKAKDVEITGNLTVQNAEIENLKVMKLDVDVADLKYATVENLEATNADIHNLTADYGEFKDLTTDKFAANEASIKKLETEKLSATDADLKYANIDFANIGKAAIENFFSKSGMIGDLVVGEGTITGTLVGVTIKGDLIEGGTVKADKLVIKGEDGLYYKLNTNGETVGAQQTEYNSLNGSIITAKSITAEKVNVNDLVAFGATIGGFHITEDAIYSGVKESIDNTTRGTYMDDDGQFAIGDGSNYLKFFKDKDGKYKLDISAASIKMGSSSLDQYVDDKIDSAVENLDVNVGARNLLLGTNKGLTNWSITAGDGAADISGKVLSDLQNINGLRIDIQNPATNYMYASFSSTQLRDILASSKDKKFTLSFDIKTDTVISEPNHIEVSCKTGTSSDTQIHFGKALVPVVDKWTHIELTGVSNGTAVSEQVLYFNLFQAVKSGAKYFEIANLKVERGNSATDWTPAPEDLQKDIDDAQESVKKNTALIEQTTESINLQVSEINQSINSNSTKITNLEQTASGWEFNFQTIEQNLDKLDQSYANQLKYIKFVDGEIWLGRDPDLGQSDFKVIISNERIRFMQDNVEIAYLSNNQLYITNTKVLNRLDLGKFAFFPRDNGNLTFRLT